jgi:hypothetical protein
MNMIQNTVARAHTWGFWIDGLIGAAIGGAANAVTIMLVKPDSFNFNTGFPDLWHFTLISSLVSAALWVKQNPPDFALTVQPPPDSTTVSTVTSVTTPNPTNPPTPPTTPSP